MNTQDCIERLEDVIDEAWNLPLSKRQKPMQKTAVFWYIMKQEHARR